MMTADLVGMQRFVAPLQQDHATMLEMLKLDSRQGRGRGRDVISQQRSPEPRGKRETKRNANMTGEVDGTESVGMTRRPETVPAVLSLPVAKTRKETTSL